MKKFIPYAFAFAVIAFLSTPLAADNLANFNNSILTGGTIAGDLEIAGNLILPNNTYLQIEDAAGTARDTLGINASDDTYLQTKNISGADLYLAGTHSGGSVQLLVGGALKQYVGTSGIQIYDDFTSNATGDLGWTLQSGANTACTTTCTKAAVFGFDTGAGAVVGPADATADTCICAGAS